MEEVKDWDGGFGGEFEAIPQRMRDSLRRYFLHGIRPGSFLTAVVENDLFGAVRHADPENLAILPTYVRWLRRAEEDGRAVEVAGIHRRYAPAQVSGEGERQSWTLKP